jgi:outer membrane biosynthesis protein TonB
MKKHKLVAALMLAVPLSSIVVACGPDGDRDQRAALEREALERELELALQPDTTVEPELTDVALPPPVEEAPPVAAPAPQRPAQTAQRPAPAPAPARTQPQPQRTQPAPSPTPAPAPAPAPAPSGPRLVSLPVPSGTTLALRTGEELSTRGSPAGTSFTATLSEPVIAGDGTTLIPAGATVRGRVTESRESGRAGQQAYLKVNFTSISFDGRTYPISATTLDAQAKLVTRDSKAEQAAKVGGGAAVGAVLGQVIGKNTRSTVAGAAIGAAAGTAVAMGTADVDAVIPQGARVTIRLDSPISVQREVG